VSQKTPPVYILNNSTKSEPIFTIFGVQNYEEFHMRLLGTRPPHLNNVAALLVWCCLLDSRQYTQHINRLFSESPAYYRGRLL